MTRTTLTPDIIELVAQRFRALAEPARLRILNSMRDGEVTVSGLVDDTGLSQANVSKHLQLLHTLGFVKRRKEGLFAYYSLADKSVFALCDIMCDRLGAEVRVRRRAIAGRA